jgi:LmbE family N-acetylglucosaminyl deacetylase
MSNHDQGAENMCGSSPLPRRDFLKGTAVTGGAVLAGELALRREAVAAEKEQIPAEGKRKTFLAVGAHMDDAEIAAGGVLIQAAKAGHRVVIVTVIGDLSSWLPTIGREEATKRDLLALTKRYGFEKRFLDYPYHQIHGGDLELKRKLAEIYVELEPDVAFIHHLEDLWPDHAACGQAAQAAFMFSEGLSHDKQSRRCPLIYACNITPHQTYHFEPDAYYDVTDVMAEYMELLTSIDSCRAGRPAEEIVHHEFRVLGKHPQTFRLGQHGLLKLADCLRFGDVARCRFAMGFHTVWGKRRGENLI